MERVRENTEDKYDTFVPKKQFKAEQARLASMKDDFGIPEDIHSICVSPSNLPKEVSYCRFLLGIILSVDDEEFERSAFNYKIVPDILKFVKFNFGIEARGFIFQTIDETLRMVEERKEAELLNYLKIWNDIDVCNKDEYYNLKIRTIEDLFEECFKIDVKRTMEYKIRTTDDFDVLSPFNITIDDLRKYSKDYVFGSLKEIEKVITLCVAECISNNSVSYIIKTGSFIRHSVNVNRKSYNIIEYMYNFHQAELKDILDFELKYFTEDNDEKKSKSKKPEEPKEKKIVVRTCKFQHCVSNLSFYKHNKSFKLFYRDTTEYFQNKKTKDCLNVFTGFKAKRDKSKTNEECLKYISKSLYHMKYVLCNYSEERNTGKDEYNYLVNWLGRVFRGEKTRTLILFWSPKGGNGKSFFQTYICRNIIGEQSSLFVGSQADIAGHFNSHMAGKSFIVVDELKDTKDDQLQQLKNITTANDTMITYKGKDSKQEGNYINIMMNTNDVSKVVVFDTGDSNRRFYIIKTNDDVRDNVNYFKELEDEMKQPEWASCFYNYIINQVDNDFQLDKPSHFKTEGAKEVKQLTSLILDFLEELRDGNIGKHYLDAKYQSIIMDVFSWTDKGNLKCKMETESIKDGVKSTCLWKAFDLMYKNKFHMKGWLQKLKLEAYVLQSLNDKEYPTDKILLCYEKESKYIFNPKYKA